MPTSCQEVTGTRNAERLSLPLGLPSDAALNMGACQEPGPPPKPVRYPSQQPLRQCRGVPEAASDFPVFNPGGSEGGRVTSTAAPPE